MTVLRRAAWAPLAVSLAAMLLLVPLLAGPVSAADDALLLADLDAQQEVPGPGDDSLIGGAIFEVYPDDGEICFALGILTAEDYEPVDLSMVTAMHIHEGVAGAAGGPVVTLPLTISSDEFGDYFEDCIDGLDSTLLEAIAGGPEGYYVNVHTTDFPDGAVRGQLYALDIPDGVQLSLSTWACPASFDGAASVPVGSELDSCTPIVRTDRTDELPSGYEFEPPPIVFDYAIDLFDEFDDQLTEDDLVPYGEIECDDVEAVCLPPNGQMFVDPYYGGDPVVFPGRTDIEINSAPAGYRFADADAWTVVEGDEGPDELEPVDLDVDVNDAELSLDTFGYSNVHIRIFFAEGSSPTKSPTPPPASGLTLPPTVTTTADVPTRSGDVLVVLGLLTILGAVALATAAAAPRLRRR